MRARDRSRLAVPAILSVVLFATWWPFRQRHLLVGDIDVRDYVLFAADAALIFFSVRLVDLIVFDMLLSRRKNVVAPQLLRGIVSIFLYVVLFAGAISAVFETKELRAILTGTTIVAAVIALALQETLGNLFGGIALHMENTYEIGDVVRSGDFMGIVEKVSWRATTLRGFNNQVMIMPNSAMAREKLEVFPRQNLNGRTLQLAIDYNVAPAAVIGVLTQAATHIEGVARETPCLARVGGFSDSAVTYEIKYYTRDYSMRDRIDADIRKAVWYALRRNEIPFAFPVRLHQDYLKPKLQTQVSAEDILERLRNVDVLSPLSDAARQTLASATRVNFYSRGEAIIRRGTMAESMFVVHSGAVVVKLTDGENTGWQRIAELGPGSVFGEMGLLTGEVRTADVVAATDVVALEIGKESLQPILKGHPDLAHAISRKMLERREQLDIRQKEEIEHEERTLITRVREFFGLSS